MIGDITSKSTRYETGENRVHLFGTAPKGNFVQQNVYFILKGVNKDWREFLEKLVAGFYHDLYKIPVIWFFQFKITAQMGEIPSINSYNHI